LKEHAVSVQKNDDRTGAAIHVMDACASDLNERSRRRGSSLSPARARAIDEGGPDQCCGGACRDPSSLLSDLVPQRCGSGCTGWSGARPIAWFLCHRH
jgi:hypothetical protein